MAVAEEPQWIEGLAGRKDGPSDHEYNFKVIMTCGGCSGAVKRVLAKVEGLNEFQVVLAGDGADKGKVGGDVFVKAEKEVEFGTVYTKIHKTGKTIKSAEEDGAAVDLGKLEV